jgi:peroxiredoxin
VNFAAKYRDRGLTVIGVSGDDDGWTSVRPYVKEHRMNYPVVIGTKDLVQRYEVTALPVTFLIDRNGAIAVVHAGLPKGGKAEVEGEIVSLLSEGAGQVSAEWPDNNKMPRTSPGQMEARR